MAVLKAIESGKRSEIVMHLAEKYIDGLKNAPGPLFRFVPKSFSGNWLKKEDG